MRTARTLALGAALAGVAVAAHARGPAAGDLLLGGGWPDLPADQRALTSVPFAPGAPAVILLEAQQHEQSFQEDGQILQRIVYFRRTKVLTAAGVENWSDFRMEVPGGERVNKVKARTLLPDGSEIEVTDGISRERTKTKDDDARYEQIRVVFPRVEPGAILDVRVDMATDYLPAARWLLQDRIPTLESRLALISPPEVRYRTAAVRLTGPEAEPLLGRHLHGKVYVWSVHDVEALPDLANLPPDADVSKAILFFPESVTGEHYFYDVATDWKGFSTGRKKALDAWIKEGSQAVTALGKAAAEGKTTPAEKIAAIRAAVAGRIRAETSEAWRSSDSPDALLERGFGTTMDLASATVVALRAAGVDADVAMVRRRGDGILPADLPITVLFNDALVRAGGGWFHPGTPVGRELPWSFRGVLALVCDGAATAPVAIPDFEASDNKTQRIVRATLSPDGTLDADETTTYSGVAAQRWRARFEDESDDTRKSLVRDDLRRTIAGAEIASLAIEGMDAPGAPLVLKAHWTADGYAASAGARRLVLPFLRNRVAVEDWAAPTRDYDVDLGSNFDLQDSVFLTLPEGATGIAVPEKASLNAGPVGRYDASVEARGAIVVASRRFVMSSHRFPAASYAGLKRWFGDIAATDAKPVVFVAP